MLKKKITFGKIRGSKNTRFFLSRAPTHDSLTFNLQFLYELKHKICLSKTVFGIFYSRICFVFIRVISQPTFTCSDLSIETLEQCVKYVQS